MKKVYIAASFAHKNKKISMERKNAMYKVAEILRVKGLDPFLPCDHPLPNAWDMTNHEWGYAVFGADIASLQTCDLVVYLSWGKTDNSAGSAWEAGYAAGLNKSVILVSMTDSLESLMTTCSSRAHLHGLDEVKNYDFEIMPIIHEDRNEVN